jgi:hypothetical protein
MRNAGWIAPLAQTNDRARFRAQSSTEGRETKGAV